MRMSDKGFHGQETFRKPELKTLPLLGPDLPPRWLVQSWETEAHGLSPEVSP